MGALEGGKYPIQNKKCKYKKTCEDAPFQTARFPKYLFVAKRLEPQQIDPVGEHRPAAEQNNSNDGDENEEPAVAAAGGRRRQFVPFEGFGHFVLTLSLSAHREIRKIRAWDRHFLAISLTPL
jgi:hypothetical protein